MSFRCKKSGLKLKKGRGANGDEDDLSTVAESVDNNIEISLYDDDDDDGDDDDDDDDYERKEHKKKMKKRLFQLLGLCMFLSILGVNAASLDMEDLIDLASVVGTRMMTSRTSTETPLPESNHISSSVWANNINIDANFADDSSSSYLRKINPDVCFL